MKKVSAREFQHHFGRLTESLKPGQVIEVTKGGRVHGVYRRAAHGRIKKPNFPAATERHPYSEKIGLRLLKRLDEALS